MRTTKRMLLLLASSFFALGGVYGQSDPLLESADIGFIGLHGGVFEQIQSHAKALRLKVKYFDDVSIADLTADLSSVDVLYIQHTREEDREAYAKQIAIEKVKKPKIRIIAFQSNTPEFLNGLHLTAEVTTDPDAAKYYGSSSENLRRLLVYTAAKFLKRELQIEPPQEVEREGFYHPDHKELFKTCEELLLWLRNEKKIHSNQPRILILISLVWDGLSAPDSLALETGRSIESLPDSISKGLQLAQRLNPDFNKTSDEIEYLLRGLDGRFVPPAHRNTLQLERSLRGNGMNAERANLLSQARIFGRAPGRESGGLLGYSVARSGDWSDRRELANEYLAEAKHVYTAGA